MSRTRDVERFDRWAERYDRHWVLTPGGRWLLADFLATGVMRTIRRLLRMSRFPERSALSAMLGPCGLRILREQKLVGLHGQVAVLAIGRPE